MNVVQLNKENDLNKLLRKQKLSRESTALLFVSLWDHHCELLLNKLQLTNNEYSYPIFSVDSFNMPHSFVIFDTKKVPCLVLLNNSDSNENIQVIDYLPDIYNYLRL